MTAPEAGAAGAWIQPQDLLNGCCPGLRDNVDPITLANATTLATNLLFRLTGRQFPGITSVTVRPCASDNGGCGGDGWMGWLWGGSPWQYFAWNAVTGSYAGYWYPFTSAELLNGCCAGKCQLSSVVLPNPVAAITQVVINGEVLDPAAYRVVNYRRLERIDGHRWPCSQDFTKDSAAGSSDASGTWQITFDYGRGPGPDGELYCAQLACEYALAMCGADECVLPPRTSRIVREGVSMELFDPILLMNQGLTGLPMVDAWIRSVNPANIQRRAHFRRLGVDPNNFQTTT
jgi:hypothetical protein